jgi:rhodanese-related sulfurtransferase
VRDATIVFACDGLARATITASWYRQLFFPNVFVVDGGTTAWQAAGLMLETGHDPGDPFGYAEAVRRTTSLEPAELATRLESQPPAMVLFVDTSREFASGHPPGARWLSRSWLELQIETLAPDRQTPLVTADADGRGAALAASTLSELGYQNVAWLRGGVRAWRDSNLPIEQGLTGVMRPPDDVVPAGPERSYADMIHYLRWEEALGRKYES